MTGLLMLVTVPIAPFLLYLIGRVTRKASEEQWREMNRFSAGLAEILRALPTLKLFSREQAERERVSAGAGSIARRRRWRRAGGFRWPPGPGGGGCPGR